MTSVRKFMFETDFDAAPGSERSGKPVTKAKPAAVREPPRVAPEQAPPPPPPPPEPSFSEAELKAAAEKARAEGERSGEARGRAAAQAENEQRIAAALEGIGGQLTSMQSGIIRDRDEIIAEASALALAILGKMLPEYSRRGGLAEIEGVLERCMRDQRREPRLVARIAPDLIPLLEPRLDPLSAKAAFEGRLFMIADDRLSETDCSVEWADGGLERHADAIWRDISSALERCLTLQDIAAAAIPADATPAGESETGSDVTDDNPADEPAEPRGAEAKGSE